MGPRRRKRKTETPRRRTASPTPATPRPTPATPRPTPATPRPTSGTPRPPPSRGPSFRRRYRRHLVLREIKNLQKSTHLLLRKAPFCRLVSSGGCPPTPRLRPFFKCPRQEKYVLNSLVVWTSVGKPTPCWPSRRRQKPF
ncbi:histone H3-like centromeric protein A isoform X2 [Phyllostomus hastatus]|uniref:histone H3-like centromeric protein A isoform X2 n=1 Tax=Phyllostomus hastatus TaxID=9423 RepID=UPI001E68524A|nr:histone H3-like centromeric protein A isoform X2 [Phyllostomus hastatus]